MVNASAPWSLSGEGFILVYKFSNEFIEKSGFMDAYQMNNWKGGLGTVMCVNYKTSNVGPYFELLFIPGIISLKNLNFDKIKKGFTISKIYVSTQDSVENGINNWGIPKEKADFEWIEFEKNRTQIRVSIGGKTFFEAIFKKKFIVFPITTSFIPLKIIQKIDSKYFLTKPTAKGKMCFAQLEKIQVNEQYFPKIDNVKPLIASNISNFNMVFPVAITEVSNN
jgi:Acetoacetate decarboxylase (ADC)